LVLAVQNQQEHLEPAATTAQRLDVQLLVVDVALEAHGEVTLTPEQMAEVEVEAVDFLQTDLLEHLHKLTRAGQLVLVMRVQAAL
jgi:hypothetical protein